MKGYRNTWLGVAFMVSCLALAWMTDPGEIKNLGPAFLSLGGGVVGVVFGRALNKKYENGHSS